MPVEEEPKISEKNGKLFIKNASQFNDQKLEIQQAIIDLYQAKKREGAFDNDLLFSRAIEIATQAYCQQLVDFSDFLTRQGFDPTLEVPALADVQVAILTYMGSIYMIGKHRAGQQGLYRIITVQRLYRFKLNIHNGKRGRLLTDAKIGQESKIFTLAGGVTTSPVRGLAVKKHGPPMDELEEHRRNTTRINIIAGIGQQTMRRLLKESHEIIVET